MATSLQTLIPLLTTIALLLTAANAQRRPPPRRTSFSYGFNGEKPTDLIYQGDAHYPSDTTFLRLTKTDISGNAQPNSAGRVLYSNPIMLWRRRSQAYFETNLRFIIKPNRGDSNPPADGLVFFIAPVNSTVQETGGSFGVFDRSGRGPSVFAIEFDIFPNIEFDPTYRHVGIDIQSQISSNVTAVGDEIVGQEVTARVDYDPSTDLIRVYGNAGTRNFEVSYLYDLRNIVPEQALVGISAATGGLVAVHDVISWSFSSTMRRSRTDNAKEGGNI